MESEGSKSCVGERQFLSLARGKRTKIFVRSPCMRATAYCRLFARGASSQGVVRQTDQVDAAEALPPLDFSILPSDEQTTLKSTPTMHIPDIPGSTVPHMSFVSPPKGLAEA
ncbi:hypothetical protein PIB30_019576 [Stylosanthes scabra]|uniref:Uncharacterized protein n=1 Tax=Stylosanthes scabra TaxID=79078 RepID=A0ABU6Y5D8_9FABA|nr:hypothetical protein [Stylosanthes scabra]